MAEPGFYNDPANSQKILQARKRLEEALTTDEELARDQSDIEVWFELASEGEDVGGELDSHLTKLKEDVLRIETHTLLSGENDRSNAIIAIHAGAGGTEAQDWAEMLLRMYLRWAERQGFHAELVDFTEGEEAGLKSATATVTGEYAYGLLVSEIGVHRLVRLSPFDSQHKRHTSFASVFVLPEVDEKIDVQIREEDLRVDTFRSGGCGGQHVNTTDSAVRITHLPTGIVTQCQNERSQHKNRAVAMKVLRARLYEFEIEKKRAASQKVEDAKLGINFGSQIRSYVLHPYRMIKDLRTRVEVGDTDRVLDGDLEPFIRAYLLSRRVEASAPS
ncbi:MAG: peptide chain release factor 2 [Acidobacteria bacterium RIFCSPLOWO2_12_FULL_60_22]|nr:MAG: peptide chain release factor 2 [Acidobacteria bacterium RIFCSPLOWO2_12_FULL_60_22]